jgi:hypothetical protein
MRYYEAINAAPRRSDCAESPAIELSMLPMWSPPGHPAESNSCHAGPLDKRNANHIRGVSVKGADRTLRHDMNALLGEISYLRRTVRP